MIGEADEILTSDDEAAKLAANEAAALKRGFQQIMATVESRRVVWEQFEAFGIYQVSASVEPAPLQWNEGRRSLALQMMHGFLSNCPELWDRMVVENRARLAQERKQ